MSAYSAVLNIVKPTLTHLAIVSIILVYPAYVIYIQNQKISNEKIAFTNEKSEFEKYKFEKISILDKREFNLEFLQSEITKKNSTIEKQNSEIEFLQSALEEQESIRMVREATNGL